MTQPGRQSSLLIDESPLQVIPSLAVAIGLNEAIMLQQIHYWQRISQHERNGRKWVAMSTPELAEKFPFWSHPTIKRTVASLRDRRLLLISRESDASWDRGNWYSVDYDAMNSLGSPSDQNDPMHRFKLTPCIGSKRPDRSDQNDPITDNGKSKDKRTPAAGQKDAQPTPVALVWKAYSEAMQARYKVAPPGNARTNGMLRGVVDRIGAEHAPAVAAHYVASNDPYYVKIHHRVEALVKDCETLLMDLQRSTGTGRVATPPKAAEVRFEYEGGGRRSLDDMPIDMPERIARATIRNYGRMVAATKPRDIVVAIGPNEHRYSIAELSQGARG